VIDANAADSAQAAFTFWSAQRVAQGAFVRSATRAAPGELSIDDDGRQTADTERLGSRRRIAVLHIVNLDVVVRTGDPLDHLDRLCARRAARAEDLDCMLCCCHSPYFSNAFTSLSRRLLEGMSRSSPGAG
jgi:hypothetical protein